MDAKGSLYLLWSNKGKLGEPEFAATYMPYAGSNRVNTRTFQGQESLREFLVGSLQIEEARVETAFIDLHAQGSAEVDSLAISEDDFLKASG